MRLYDYVASNIIDHQVDAACRGIDLFEQGPNEGHEIGFDEDDR